MEYIEELLQSRGLDTKRVSDLLKDQLKYFMENRMLNIHGIVDELVHLEYPNKPTQTKPEKPLTGDVLSGFWHKHFSDARYIVRNIINQLHDRKYSKHIDRTMNELAKHAPYVTDVMGQIMNLYVDGAYFSRSTARQLTGEWIVFKKHDGKNFYLSVALHGEGDDVIMERMRRNCTTQYPALFK